MKIENTIGGFLMIGRLHLVSNGRRDGYVSVPTSLDGQKNFFFSLKKIVPMDEIGDLMAERRKGSARNINGLRFMRYLRVYPITYIG